MRAETEPGATLVWNPEFLREGHAVADTLNPDRFVYGIPDGSEEHPAVAVLDQVYADAARRRHTPARARLRHRGDGEDGREVVPRGVTKISFINAMAEVAQPPGPTSPGWLTHRADERIGREFLNAGIGFGGGCLPKDIRAFMARAGELGADQALTFLREVDAINMRRRTGVVELTRDRAAGPCWASGSPCWGGFRARERRRPGLPRASAAAQLQLQGAVVRSRTPRRWPTPPSASAELPARTGHLDTTLRRADAALLLTEWQAYGSWIRTRPRRWCSRRASWTAATS